jgi:hypothetical protein
MPIQSPNGENPSIGSLLTGLVTDIKDLFARK